MERQAIPHKRHTKAPGLRGRKTPRPIPKNFMRFNQNGLKCMRLQGKQCVPGKVKGSKECNSGSGSEDLRASGGVILVILISLHLWCNSWREHKYVDSIW